LEVDSVLVSKSVLVEKLSSLMMKYLISFCFVTIEQLIDIASLCDSHHYLDKRTTYNK